MYKSKHNLNPTVFDNTFTEIHHGYPTKFSRSNFKQPKMITKTTIFAISSRVHIYVYIHIFYCIFSLFGGSW